MQGVGDAGSAQHAPWATSVGHRVRIVREAAQSIGRGRERRGKLPQPGKTTRALLCPPLRAQDARRPHAHQRHSLRLTASQRYSPPEAGTKHCLIGHAWPLVQSHSEVMDRQYACTLCASRANLCVCRKTGVFSSTEVSLKRGVHTAPNQICVSRSIIK